MASHKIDDRFFESKHRNDVTADYEGLYGALDEGLTPDDDPDLAPDSVESEKDAEKEMRALQYWTRALADAEREINERRAYYTRRIEFHKAGALSWFKTTDKPTWKTLWGTCRRTAGKERIKAVDVKAFIRWCKEQKVMKALLRYKVTIEPDVPALKAYQKIHGKTMPPGLKREMGDDTFSVKVDA